MAMSKETFDNYLAKILSARYGEEVRGSIHDSLQGMYEIVQQNILDVNTAKQMLNAVETLNQIKTEATNAANAANQAASNLNQLKTEASNAASSANAAASAANTASSNATEAFKKASEAAAAANNAVLAAQSATSDANAAASRTNTAISKANEAANSVNEAKQAALNAANSVEEAKTAALNAANSVEEAKTAALNAASTANTAASNADEATSKANTAASNADTATSKANTAASNANEKATAASEATSKANEAANSVNEAKQAATEATSKANTAASNADEATSKANTAASNADEATSKANTAASNADEATTNATQAADRANSAAQIVEDLQIGDLDIGSIATKEYVSEQIDGIEIGGRNIIPDSSFELGPGYGWNNYSNVVQEGVDGGKCLKVTMDAFNLTINTDLNKNYISRKIVDDWRIKAGDKVTISAWVKTQNVVYGNTNSGITFVIAYWNDDDYAFETDLSLTALVSETKDWTRYSNTATVPNVPFTRVESFMQVRDLTGTVWVDQIKVERGDKATDWSPAPEDVDAKIDRIEIGGRNYVHGSSGEWSEWITPQYNTWWNTSFSSNDLYAYFPEDKKVGDSYTASFEVEFSGVTKLDEKDFLFTSQGEFDDTYIQGENVWDYTMCNLMSPPRDGVYRYSKTYIVNDLWKNSIKKNIIFVAQNWNTGKFRFRNIKIERGNKATDWSPAPYDMQPAIFDSAGDVQLSAENLQKLATALKTYLN